MPFPAGKSDYPAVADLQAELANAGLIAVEQDHAAALAAGIRAIETATSRKFLAAPATYAYDFPEGGRRLALRRELLSLSSLSVGGVVKTLNTDFWLYPEDAGQDGYPYHALDFVQPYFYSYPGGSRRAVSVTGLWGAGLTIPEDVWKAMLLAGCLWLADSQRFTDTGGASSVRREVPGGGSVVIESNPAVFAALRSGWEKQVQAVIERRKNTAAYL